MDNMQLCLKLMDCLPRVSSMDILLENLVRSAVDI